jgi:hypothetical protein
VRIEPPLLRISLIYADQVCGETNMYPVAPRTRMRVGSAISGQNMNNLGKVLSVEMNFGVLSDG